MTTYRSFCHEEDGRFSHPSRQGNVAREASIKQLVYWAQKQKLISSLQDNLDKPEDKIAVRERLFTKLRIQVPIQDDADACHFAEILSFLLNPSVVGLPVFPEVCLNRFLRIIWEPNEQSEPHDRRRLSYFDRFLKANHIPPHAIPSLTEAEVCAKKNKVPHARNGRDIDVGKMPGWSIVMEKMLSMPSLLDKYGNLRPRMVQYALTEVMPSQPPSIGTLRTILKHSLRHYQEQHFPFELKVKEVTVEGFCQLTLTKSREELEALDSYNFKIPAPDRPIVKEFVSANITSFFGVEPLGLVQMAIAANKKPQQLAVFNNDLISLIHEEKFAKVLRAYLEDGGTVVLVYHLLEEESKDEVIQKKTKQNEMLLGKLSDRIRILVYAQFPKCVQFSGILVDIRQESAMSFINPFIAPFSKLDGKMPVIRAKNVDLLSLPELREAVKHYMD